MTVAMRRGCYCGCGSSGAEAALGVSASAYAYAALNTDAGDIRLLVQIGHMKNRDIGRLTHAI